MSSQVGLSKNAAHWRNFDGLAGLDLCNLGAWLREKQDSWAAAGQEGASDAVVIGLFHR